MFSKKKPPLPKCSIISKRPELFCLNYKQVLKECEEFNHAQEINNNRAWNEFHKKFVQWKTSC